MPKPVNLPQSTIALAPLAVQYGHICRWMWLAIPEDVQQEIAATLIEFPALAESAREKLIRYRLAELRYQVWNRDICRRPRVPSSLRPSKLAKASGYRTNSAAHREARLTINPETRRAIARKGALACQTQ